MVSEPTPTIVNTAISRTKLLCMYYEESHASVPSNTLKQCLSVLLSADKIKNYRICRLPTFLSNYYNQLRQRGSGVKQKSGQFPQPYFCYLTILIIGFAPIMLVILRTSKHNLHLTTAAESPLVHDFWPGTDYGTLVHNICASQFDFSYTFYVV